MFEKAIQGYLQQGLRDAATDSRVLANLFQVLPEVEQERAVKWVQNNVDQIKIVLGFTRETPTSPLISVIPSSEVETDPPVGGLGEDIVDADTGQRVNLSGTWFDCSYRIMVLSSNADACTYLASIVRQTLIRYRSQLNTNGLFEQKISLTDLMPSEEFNDPNIDIFQRGVELSGTAFIGYDDVQPDGYASMTSDPSLTFISTPTDTATIVFRASKITDTFVRANNTATMGRTSSGHLWTALSGAWGITSNAGYLVVAGADHRSLATTTVIADGRISMTVNAPTGARLAFRFTDKDNGYYVEAQANQYVLERVVAGVITTIGTYSVTPKSGDQVMASLANASISIFVNGAIAINVSQSFNQTATLHGIGATDTSIAQWSAFSIS